MTAPTVVQIVHAEAGGGVETLARMIEAELNRRGFVIETRVLYSRPDLPAAKKLAAVVNMAGQLLRNPPDALIAYQATASLLIGLLCGVALPHLFIGFMIKRRKKKFLSNFPDAIDVLVRGLKAGLPAAESMRTEVAAP